MIPRHPSCLFQLQGATCGIRELPAKTKFPPARIQCVDHRKLSVISGRYWRHQTFIQFRSVPKIIRRVNHRELPVTPKIYLTPFQRSFDVSITGATCDTRKLPATPRKSPTPFPIYFRPRGATRGRYPGAIGKKQNLSDPTTTEFRGVTCGIQKLLEEHSFLISITEHYM